MSIRFIRRIISEAVSNIFKNGLMTIASLFVVTSCLFIFGVFLTVSLNINYLSEQLANQCQVQVYITKEASNGGMIQGISDQIKKLDNVENVTFELGIDTFENFKKDLSPEELSSFEGLPNDMIDDSFKITLSDISLSKQLVSKVKNIEGVSRVENRQDVINIVNSITKTVRSVSIWIVLIFAFVSVFIISNTIKLTVHNRRKEINIMKYVGATDSFIRGPFMMEGLIVGIIASIISFFITQSCYIAVVNAVGSTSSIGAIIRLNSFGEMWYMILCSYIALGAIIGAIGSAISIRKYLKV